MRDPARISPGYWFLSPYDVLPPPHRHGRDFPAQIGPHIFDNRGVYYSFSGFETIH